jgi:hypothetical protein
MFNHILLLSHAFSVAAERSACTIAGCSRRPHCCQSCMAAALQFLPLSWNPFPFSAVVPVALGANFTYHLSLGKAPNPSRVAAFPIGLRHIRSVLLSAPQLLSTLFAPDDVWVQCPDRITPHQVSHSHPPCNQSWHCTRVETLAH